MEQQLFTVLLPNYAVYLFKKSSHCENLDDKLCFKINFGRFIKAKYFYK